MRSYLSGLTLEYQQGIATVTLDRPSRANALDAALWRSLADVFAEIDDDPSIRVVVLTGAGRHFCAGIDLTMLEEVVDLGRGDCSGRSAEAVHDWVRRLQQSISAVEDCRKPVIAAVAGSCIGAGLDLIAACDLRIATSDARFCLKEVDYGIVADLGVLQRLPRIVGDGVTREMALTARTVGATEALARHLVTHIVDDRDALAACALALAETIASKSPLAIRGTKRALNYARDHTVTDGLAQVATWNSGTLLSADLTESLAARQAARPTTYPN